MCIRDRLKPLEKKIIKDFNCSEFIFCSDAGLGSANNRAFNSIGNRAYVITHSLKKMKQEDLDIALNPTPVSYTHLDVYKRQSYRKWKKAFIEKVSINIWRMEKLK